MQIRVGKEGDWRPHPGQSSHQPATKELRPEPAAEGLKTTLHPAAVLQGPGQGLGIGQVGLIGVGKGLDVVPAGDVEGCK